MEEEGLIKLKIVFVLVTVFLLGMLIFVFYMRKKTKKQTINEKKLSDYGRQIIFTIKNRTDKKLELDINDLECKDERYSFITSLQDYKKFLEYIKVYSLNVVATTVKYNNDCWTKDIVKLKRYNPFEYVSVPVLFGLHHYQNFSDGRFAQSYSKYNYDYFNSLLISLNPNEEKTLTLFIVESDIDESLENIKCAFTIKNNTNTLQRVDLFDKKYLKKIQQEKNVDITSIFDINDYKSVVSYFNKNILTAQDIRVYSPDTKSISYKINFDEYEETNVNRRTKQEKSYYIIGFENEKYINNFSIDLPPNTEILISFK